MSQTTSDRGQWSSQIGFVLAAAGSAIGLGNIWRFPYSAGENGGGAFLIVYLICVVALGLPVMLLEIALGRATQKNPVGALRAIRARGGWQLLGYLAILTGLGILSFYAVIAGQVLAVCLDYVQRPVTGTVLFPTYGVAPSLFFFALFTLLTVLVVAGGVQRGIERWAKILMPLLLVMMLGIMARGLLLPGAAEGIRWLLLPDFSKITLAVVLDAMSQAFFSLSLGMGAMLTYGSYLSRRQSLLQSAGWVVFFDTFIAILAGLMIFPAVFALGKEPGAGPTLIFQVLPEVFASMPGGQLVAAVFFFLLAVAALTSTVSLLEVVSAYFIDERGWTRRRTVWTAGAATLVVGIPSALSWVGTQEIFGWMDFVWVNLSLPFGALMLCLFGSAVWGLRRAVDEIREGSPAFHTVAGVWRFFIAVVCPLFIAIILVTRVIPL